MLGTIWEMIGIIVGFIVLVPLLILLVVFVFAFIKYLFDLAILAGAEAAEWIDEKIFKK